MKAAIVLTTLCTQVIYWNLSVAEGAPNPNTKFVANYLQKYKFMDKSIDTDYLDNPKLEEIIQAPLARFNQIHHTGEGGQITEETIEEMEKPRCANPDIDDEDSEEDSNAHRRIKRFSLLNKAKHLWKNYPITIGFKNYYHGISHKEQDRIAVECARKWAEVSGVSFRPVRNQMANIYIRFEPIKGDKGEGGTVGEAQSPTPFKKRPSSYLRIDSREKWIPEYKQGVAGLSLMETICHEIGHTLSLGHSEDEVSLMYPVVGSRGKDIKLSNDDVEGIQSLYGQPNGKTVENEEAFMKEAVVERKPDEEVGVRFRSPVPSGSPDLNCSRFLGKNRRRKCQRASNKKSKKPGRRTSRSRQRRRN